MEYVTEESQNHSSHKADIINQEVIASSNYILCFSFQAQKVYSKLIQFYETVNCYNT